MLIYFVGRGVGIAIRTQPVNSALVHTRHLALSTFIGKQKCEGIKHRSDFSF